MADPTTNWGAVPERVRDDCAPPIWANVMIERADRSPVFNGSMGLHGLPRVGDVVYVDGDRGGVVRMVRWDPCTTGELKPTVWVEQWKRDHGPKRP